MRGERNAVTIVRNYRLLLLGTAVLLVGPSGCGSSDPKIIVLTKPEQHLTWIAMAYREAYDRLGRGPKNADELKPYLKEFGDPEELLISPNDRQPYVVVWNVNPNQGGPTLYEGMWQIIAYELKGSGGKRAVTDIRGRPMTVPDEDFSKLTFVGRHKPAS
jgi:hypothetical protein